MDGTPPGVFLGVFLDDFSSTKRISVRFYFDKTKDYDGILSQNPKIDQNLPKMLKKSKSSPK